MNEIWVIERRRSGGDDRYWEIVEVSIEEAHARIAVEAGNSVYGWFWTDRREDDLETYIQVV